MKQVCRVYLRASTLEQDATRAHNEVMQFAKDNNLYVAAKYIANESGASLARPELMRLIDEAQEGDILLVEEVTRLSRLTATDWEALKAMLHAKRIRVVALDLPTSHQLVKTGDDFTGRMLDALNGMMLDMLAAIARKDYDDRRKKQAQGITKAKAAGKFKGRPDDALKQARVADALKAGMTQRKVAEVCGVSLALVNKVAKGLKDNA
ncbi:recombinase family protein [Enterobacter roggenkampii]|uniref:recombinase family protein n=1 Tax=Enterobacter roggenkampii TaxID=1812935 RepID=UPI001BE0327D|nr:recombinase family protein [Enterobacter roggenkampii]MBT1889477.1 recombinase family protein [Enterobacter roggenkampii]